MMMVAKTGIPKQANGGAQRRNRNFEDTHRLLIEKAVEIISHGGLDTLSVSALARETGINRSTVYYHFDSRDALVVAIKAWSAEQLVSRYQHNGNREARMAQTIGFVLDKPEVMKLWIEDLLESGDIRDRYPEWDNLVAMVTRGLRQASQEGPDAEVFSVMLLVAVFIAPRIFKNSIRPDLSDETIIARFADEQYRLLVRAGFEAEAVAGPEATSAG